MYKTMKYNTIPGLPVVLKFLKCHKCPEIVLKSAIVLKFYSFGQNVLIWTFVMLSLQHCLYFVLYLVNWTLSVFWLTYLLQFRLSMFILDALHFRLVVHSVLELDSVEISVEFIIRHYASKNVFQQTVVGSR